MKRIATSVRHMKSLHAYEAQRILEGSGLGGVKFLDGGIACWPFERAKG